MYYNYSMLVFTDTVYLDHAGATLVARSQLEAHHKDILDNVYGNPHSRSQSSQLTADTIDQIRYRWVKIFKEVILKFGQENKITGTNVTTSLLTLLFGTKSIVCKIHKY